MQNYMYKPMVYRALPVSSEMEANNITVDFSGMPTYLHNQQTNEIYVKQFDIKTGLTTMQKYVKSDGTINDSAGVKPDFDINAYDEKLNTLNERMDDLEKMLEKGGKR